MPSKKLIIIFVILLVIIGAIAVVIILGGENDKPTPADLTIWGVYDDSDAFQKLITGFRAAYPNIDVEYYKKNHQTYEKDLLNDLAAGQGPDIFFIHHTWLPKYQDKITPLPKTLNEAMDFIKFRDTFVDVAVHDFTDQTGQIYALPLFVDTLALYWNKDIFNSAGVSQPPTDWNEFLEAVKETTVKDEQGNIVRAGAAIGTAKNINRSTDILSLLIIQAGAKMIDDKKTKATFNQQVDSEENPYPGQNALEFYTQFADPSQDAYTWNSSKAMPYSIDGFAENKVAMMFNYSYHLPTIRAKAPYLNFDIAPMPQNGTVKINYANYWGMAVAKNSNYPEQAWRFILWLSQIENAKQYLEITKRPTIHRQLIDWQKNDPDLSVFAQQALSARSWYQVDSLAIEDILADMIESVVAGQAEIDQAVDKAADQITLLMRP